MRRFITVYYISKLEEHFVSPENSPAKFLDEGFLMITTIDEDLIFIQSSEIRKVTVKIIK